uniref:Pentraxin family member n=1 Tax=Apteryx owenii TaxID=8824 RepID=A0A8B9S4V6_APTOW
MGGNVIADSLWFFQVLNLALSQLSTSQQKTLSYVNIQPHHDMTLQAFTLCFRTKAQKAGSQTVLSCSTQQRDNELLVTVGTDVGLGIGGHFISFPLHYKSEDWLHYCMAWASQSGTADLRLNGAVGKAKSIQKGYVTQAGGTLVLGKDRHTLLGTFSNGFAGWMTRVNLWSQVLNAADVRALALCKPGQLKGHIIAWGETPMTLLGGMVLESDTSCE